MTDQRTTVMINSLLADLVGQEDRVRDLPEMVHPEDLPGDMQFQREVLGVLNDCSVRDIRPTRGNVLMGLHVTYDHTDDGVEQQLDDLLEFQTEFGDVRTGAAFVHEWIRKTKARAALARGLDTVGGPADILENQLDKVIADLVDTRTVFDDTYIDRTMSDMAQFAIEMQRQRTKIMKEGLPPGPSLKFKGFVGETDQHGNPKTPAKVPHLRWGQTTLVTGREGSGKTTFGSVWAEHNAWHLGYDVLYLHNETEQDTLWDRIVSRNLVIPSDYQSSGRLDIDDEDNPVAQRYWNFLEWVQQPIKKHPVGGKFVGKESGEIHYVYCPGWDVHKINARIRLARQRADLRKRGLLIFMDYYQLIDLSGVYGDSKADRLGQVAFHLRECIKQENMKSQKSGGIGVHCVVFSQESGDGKESYAYGSRIIGQYSQLIISIKRTLVDSDWMVGTVQKPKLDALGNKRYWHRTGEWGGITELVVIKGNSFSKGTVTVWMENAMSRVQDPEKV